MEKKNMEVHIRLDVDVPDMTLEEFKGELESVLIGMRNKETIESFDAVVLIPHAGNTIKG
jgi:hypothetical protein